MAEPTPYRPTYGNKAQYGAGSFVNTYYLPNGTTAWEVGLDKELELANATGFTYTAPLIQAPFGIFRTPSNVRYGLTGSKYSLDSVYFFQNLPYFKRMIQPFWLNNMAELPFNFLADSINTPWGSTITLYNDDWTTGTTTARSYAIWPEIGISKAIEYLGGYSQFASSTGATVYIVMGDAEGSLSWTTTAKREAIAGHTNYSLPLRGLSSYKEIYEYYAAGAGFTSASYSSNALIVAREKYRSKYQGIAWYEGYKVGNPDITLSNYDDFSRDIPLDFFPDNTINEDGGFEVMGDPVGNAHAPQCYLLLRQFDYKTTDTSRISDSNPYRFAKTTDSDYWKSQYPQKGPWASFMPYYAYLREARRLRPELPLTPWIGDVNYVFFNAYRHFTYTLTSQSPPDVLHNTWDRENMDSLFSYYKGYTSFDGTTNAYRLSTAPLGVTAGTIGLWYDQNISGITYDGSTSEFKITTVGNTGVTASLALYYSGISSGATYVFSYEIDLSRGFTGSLARFITGWATTNGITLAPERPTTTTSFSGITFTQVEPILGITSYNLIGPIGYSSGSSGWTKVAWRFVGTSTSSNMGLHLYYARNPTGPTSGYEIYVRNPVLFNETSGITVSTAPIDYEYAPTTAVSSFKYYYDGLTAGLTYVFSYYIDLSRGFTQTDLKLPNNQQIIEHFTTWDYSATPRGITFRQISPTISGVTYNYSGISYGSSTGWTKVSWEFVVNNKSVGEPYINKTLMASLYTVNNFYSVTNPLSSITGYNAFFANPTLEYYSGATLVPALEIRDIDSTFRRNMTVWDWAPSNGCSNCKLGYDDRSAFYARERGGNSAYYYEFIRHACLMGTKSFGYFNAGMFKDMRVPGMWNVSIPRSDENSSAKYNLYARAGNTDYIQVLADFNACLGDVHEKIKGFTLTTADTSKVNWLAPYVASGAPAPNGVTWWWRLTVKPGYTLYCKGNTLSSNTTPGMWISTTGPTLAGITITTTKWPVAIKEPTSVGSPIRDFDFTGMTGLASLTAAGFTFSRGSTATFINSQGLVEIVGNNIPRFEYDPITLLPKGLMIESARTNSLNWSESFAITGGSQNNWVDTNISRQSGNTSPSGNTSAIRFTASSANGTLISSTGAGGLTNAVFSFWARGITGNENLSYTFNNGAEWTGVTLQTIWTRFVSGVSTGNHQIGFKLENTGNAVELWGVQLESAGTSYVTPVSSYIPTINTTSTRSADVASIPSSNFSTWFGITYGVVILEHENTIRLRFWNGTTSNRYDYRYRTGGSEIERVKNGVGSSYHGIHSASQYSETYPQTPIDTPVKIGWSWAPEGTKSGAWFAISSIYGWGASGVTTPPLVNSMELAQSYSSGGYVRRIRIWDKIFSDSEFTQMLQGDFDNPCLWNPYG